MIRDTAGSRETERKRLTFEAEVIDRFQLRSLGESQTRDQQLKQKKTGNYERGINPDFMTPKKIQNRHIFFLF